MVIIFKLDSDKTLAEQLCLFIHSFMYLVIHHLFNRPASEVFLEAP